MSRDIDHGWEALVEVTNANVSQERGALNRALALIKQQAGELEGDELALVITHQAGLYREVFPTMPLTANALAKWWGKLDEEAERLRALDAEKAAALAEKRKTRGVNLSVESNCVTCHGNLWVTVGHRVPKATAWARERKIEPKLHPSDPGHEQTAPCPVCNAHSSVMPGYWDGKTWAYGERPGELVIS